MRVLKFYADWCGPCKALTRTLNEHYKGNVPIEEVNIDTHTDEALSFGIRSVPTCVLVDEHGTEIKRKVGNMTMDEFEQFVRV